MVQHRPRMAAFNSQAGRGGVGIQNVHESRLGEEFNEFVAGRSCVRGRGGVEVVRTNTGRKAWLGPQNRICGCQSCDSNILELAKLA